MWENDDKLLGAQPITLYGHSLAVLKHLLLCLCTIGLLDFGVTTLVHNAPPIPLWTPFSADSAVLLEVLTRTFVAGTAGALSDLLARVASSMSTCLGFGSERSLGLEDTLTPRCQH